MKLPIFDERAALAAQAAKARESLGVESLETGFADFQNDALIEREGRKDGSHEEAAHEKRNWVRLSYDCNNHCTFCLDSDAHNGTMRATQDIKVQIVEGRKRGSERLILSGGEPTMHPNFLDFVKLGRRAGYRKVQTVTNGRMFKYPEFLNRAADNGLDEITFSLHGHTAKLHDALVGTPGAFVEETAGLKAALASGRFIVNVDIVINKQNVRHLPEMLETFIGWGVKEFDLLHVIPFGNAWTEARDHLFYDLDGNLEYLQKAFAYARRPDIHIWLNRFPPAYAEGFEDLIQDPYKLNDEVRGRREEFERYLAFGKKLQCREPERCHRCYLQPLCDGLDDVLSARKAPDVDEVRLTHGMAPTVQLPDARTVRVVAKDLTAAAALVRSVGTASPSGDRSVGTASPSGDRSVGTASPSGDRSVGATSPSGERSVGTASPSGDRALPSKAPELVLELLSYAGLAEAIAANGRVFDKVLVRCDTGSVAEARALLAMKGTFQVGVKLTKATEAFLLVLVGASESGSEAASPAKQAGLSGDGVGDMDLRRLVIVQPNYDRVTDALTHDVDASAFFSRLGASVPVENVPPCVAGEGRVKKALRVLDGALLGPDGRVDMKLYTQRFVEDGFYTKALRCKDCSANDACRGVHVNWVRAHSFAALSPR